MFFFFPHDHLFYFILVINSQKQILNITMTPKWSILKIIYSKTLKEVSPSLLQAYSFNCIHWDHSLTSLEPQVHGLFGSLRIHYPSPPLYAYTAVSTRVPHSALGLLIISINALFSSEQILDHIFMGKDTLAPDFVNFMT